MPEHVAISDPNIHEPKGVASAGADEVYHATGSGSGTWKSIALPTEPNKVKFVNSASDLPTAVASAITLAPDTVYVISESITLADRFVLSEGSCVTALNRSGVTLTYTGTGVMFSGTDVSSNVREIALDCPSGTLFDIEDTVGGVKNFSCRNVAIVSAAKFGTFDSLSSLEIRGTGCLNIASGVTFAGATAGFVSIVDFALVSSSPTFTGIDLGVAVSNTWNFNNITLVGTGGGTAFSGASSSANISAGQVGHISRCSAIGTLTPLVGLSKDDVRWRFKDNSSNIPDTSKGCLISLNGNATATTIGAASTPVKVSASTWVEEDASYFSSDTSGTVTFIGESDQELSVSFFTTIASSGGGTDLLKVYLAKNGVPIAASGRPATASSTDAISITGGWSLSLSQGDTLELWVSNETDTSPITMSEAVVNIH